MRPPDPPAAAARQDGLFTSDQARAAGLSSFRIRGLVSSGIWRPVLGNVLLCATTELTRRRTLRAGALATGGVLTHLSAAEMWSAPATRDVRVHVTVGTARHVPVDGMRMHRRRLHSRDVVVMDGIPVSSRSRMLVECMAWLPYPDALRLLDHAMRTGWLTVDGLDRLVRGAKHTHGVPQLRQLLDAVGSGSWSEAERHMHRLLRGSRITGWMANAAVQTVDGKVVLVDVWFPRDRLAIEIDGRAWHVSADQFQRDRTRQNSLVLVGATVLRFTWADVTGRPGAVVRSVRAALSRVASDRPTVQ